MNPSSGPTENIVVDPLPIEVQNIIDIINENVTTMLSNRERLRALFDASAGIAPKALMANNDWTLLRDLYVQEMSNAVAGLQSAVNQTQNLV